MIQLFIKSVNKLINNGCYTTKTTIGLCAVECEVPLYYNLPKDF